MGFKVGFVGAGIMGIAGFSSQIWDLKDIEDGWYVTPVNVLAAKYGI